MEKNERAKVKEGKEHIFKSDMQGEISNKQLLISNRLHENVKEHRYRNTHSHNLSCMYVCIYREWVYRKSNRDRENTKDGRQPPSGEKDMKRTAT